MTLMKRYLKIILLSIVVVLNIIISVYFVLNHGILNTDILFHYDRLKGLWALISHCQYPLLRTQFGTLQGNAIYVMYPWLTLIPFLPLLLFSEHTTIFLLETSIIISIYIVSYLAPKSIRWTWSQRLMFSLTYTALAEPSITLRGDVGLALAMAFLPLVLFGLCSLITGCRYKELLIGLLLVAYSHVPTTFLLLIILIIIGLVDFPVVQDHWHLIFRTIVCFIIGTIPEWLIAGWLIYHNHIMSPQIPYQTPHVPYPFCSDSITTFLPLFALVLPILLICGQNICSSKLDKILFTIGLFCCLMDVKYIGGVLVRYLSILKVIQFGSRFLPFTILFWTFLLCKNVYLTNNHAAYQLLHMCICCSLLFTMFLSWGKSAISPRTNDYHHLNNFKGYLLPYASRRMPYQFHYASEYDYAPRQAVYSRGHFSSDVQYATSNGVSVKSIHLERNQTLPITIYHGLRYQFTINHHALNSSIINWKLTDRYQLLTIKKMPAHIFTIRIRSVALDK